MNYASDFMRDTFGSGWAYLVAIGITIIIIAINRKF